MEAEWTRCTSRAVEGYRYLRSGGVLQIAFRQGRSVYDYPCDPPTYERFVRAPSKGRFVDEVLKPHARRLG
jgi:hypothetical protein